MEFISASVSKMERLINAILKLSRLERRELLLEKLDMNKIVQDTLKSFAYQIKEIGAIISVKNMPETIADKMKADRIIGFKFAPGTNRFVPRAFAVKDYIEVMIECNIPMFVNSKDGTSLSDMADILNSYPELTMVITYADVWPNDRFLRPFAAEYKKSSSTKTSQNLASPCSLMAGIITSHIKRI